MHRAAVDCLEHAHEEPSSERARALAARLASLDEAGWAALLPTLRSIAARVASRFSDVASEEDVLGELALRSHERWLAEWAAAVAAGTMRRPLWVFLHDRLRDHVREARRTQRRRRALLGLPADGPSVETGLDDAPVARALFASAPPAPDDDLGADELRAVSTDRDPRARAMLALREAGYSQDEIAVMLATSRPTVTRSLAAVGAALAAALVVLLLWVSWRRSEDPPTPLRPDGERAPLPGQLLGTRDAGVRSGDAGIRDAAAAVDAAAPSRTEAASADAEVRACVMRGDNACVVRLLEGRAQTEWQLSTLIEAYRARGQSAAALGHMRAYVQRFEGARARQYRQILAAQGPP